MLSTVWHHGCVHVLGALGDLRRDGLGVLDLHGAAAEEVAHPEGLALLPREPGALGSRLEGGAGGGVSH